MCPYGADADGLDDSVLRLKHLQPLTLYRTDLLFRFEQQRRHLFKKMVGRILNLNLVLKILQQLDQGSVFFIPCSSKSRAIISGVAITCFWATALEI